MKIRDPLFKIFLLVSTISFTAAAHGFAGDKPTGGVTIKKDAIIMHAGTKLSKDDEKALNDVLKKFDKSLYRIEKFQNGKVEKSIGDLKVHAQLQSEVTKAMTTGSTDSAVSFTQGPNPAVQATQTDAQKLMKEIKPILEKYSKP